MTTLSVRHFRGIFPKIASTNLPLGAAVEAIDCVFRSRSVSPLREALFVSGLEGEKRYFCPTPDGFSGVSNRVRPVSFGDRVFYVEEGRLKFFGAGGSSGSLPISRPEGDFSVSHEGGAGEEFRHSFGLSWRNRWGEEGSLQVISADARAGSIFSFSFSPPEGIEEEDIVAAVVYHRLGAGFWGEVGSFSPLIGVGVVRSLGETGRLRSTQDLARPSDMKALDVSLHPNGWLVVSTSEGLFLSETDFPGEFPSSFFVRVRGGVIGAEEYASEILIFVDGLPPQVLSGDIPQSVVRRETEISYPCVAPGGVARVGGDLLYPSRTGIVGIRSGLRTMEQFDRETFGAYLPLSAGGRESEYWALGAGKAWMMDFEAGGEITTLSGDWLQFMSWGGSVYGLRGRSVYRMSEGSGYKRMRWRWRDNRLPAKETHSKLRVRWKGLGSESVSRRVNPLGLGGLMYSSLGAAEEFESGIDGGLRVAENDLDVSVISAGGSVIRRLINPRDSEETALPQKRKRDIVSAVVEGNVSLEEISISDVARSLKNIHSGNR